MGFSLTDHLYVEFDASGHNAGALPTWDPTPPPVRLASPHAALYRAGDRALMGAMLATGAGARPYTLPSSIDTSYDTRHLAGRSSPIVFHDSGRSVWFAGGDTIVSSCLAYGEVQWYLRYDPVPSTVAVSEIGIGLPGGDVLLDAGEILRVDSSGRVVDRRPRDHDVDAVVAMSPDCGVLLRTRDGYEWWAADDLLVTRSLGDFPRATPRDLYFQAFSVGTECQLLTVRATGDNGLEMVSLGLDARTTWTVPVPPGWALPDAAPIALDDGGLLAVLDAPPAVARYSISGDLLWAHPIAAPDGHALIPGASVLFPDGVLVVLTSAPLGGDITIVAVATGGTPSWIAGWGDSGGAFGGNWARTNAPL